MLKKKSLNGIVVLALGDKLFLVACLKCFNISSCTIIIMNVVVQFNTIMWISFYVIHIALIVEQYNCNIRVTGLNLALDTSVRHELSLSMWYIDSYIKILRMG